MRIPVRVLGPYVRCVLLKFVLAGAWKGEGVLDTQSAMPVDADRRNLARNPAATENGTMPRDTRDLESEARFHLLLLEVERPAALAVNRAGARATEVWLSGSCAPTMLKLMTPAWRDRMFSELARAYPKSPPMPGGTRGSREASGLSSGAGQEPGQP